MEILWKYKRRKGEDSSGRVYFHWFCTSVFPNSKLMTSQRPIFNWFRDKKRLRDALKWGKIDIHSSTGLIVILIDFFPTFITQVLPEVSYLVICISWSFNGCRVCFPRQPWKYYENTNDEKMRTLLAGYTFIAFSLLCFQTVTSCPLRGLFSIGWETKQLTCFPSKFTLFNNHNSNKNNNIFSFTKFSRPYNLRSRNYSPKFKLYAV